MPATPVILVPGFLGSSLEQPPSIIGPTEVWLNPLRIATGSWTKLQLPVEGEPAPPYPSTYLRAGKALTFYYGLLCGNLVARGWRVYLLDADWRKPIVEDAARLASRVRELSGDGQVQLLCHSRGGLVARSAIGMLAASGEANKVQRVITLGTPHTGSLTAAINIAAWSSLQRSLVSLGNQIPGYVSAYLGLKSIIAVMRTWPSLYELLPPTNAPWLTINPPTALYQAATYTGSGFNPPQPLLDAAVTNWSTLPPQQAGVDWIDVAGLGVFTPKTVPDLGSIVERGSIDGDTGGDGVVPFQSAHPGAKRLVTVPCNHDLLPCDGRLFAVLNDALTAGLPADVAIEGPVLTM